MSFLVVSYVMAGNIFWLNSCISPYFSRDSLTKKVSFVNQTDLLVDIFTLQVCNGQLL